jgi:hypothetical protein
MIYLKSLLAGIALLIGCVALFTQTLGMINLDARYMMGHYPFISLPIMLVVFAIGFLGQFHRGSRR